MRFAMLFLLALAFLAGLFVGRQGVDGGKETAVVVAEKNDRRVLSALPTKGRVGVVLGELIGGVDIDDDELRTAALFGRTEGMGVAEIDRLLAEIARTKPENRKQLENALILRLMEIDLGEAWTLLSKIRPGDTEETVGDRTGEWVHKIFEQLAKGDLEKGKQLAVASDESIRRYAIEELLDSAEGGAGALELIRWAKSVDPEFADFGDSLDDFKDGGSFYMFFPDHGVFSRWAQSDRAGALGYVLGLEGGSERKQGLDGIAEGLAVADPDAAVAFAKGLDDQAERAAAWWKVMAVLASSRPADAARLFDEMPSGDQKRRSLTTLAERWIQSDPLAAQAWIESLPDARTRQTAYKSASLAMQRKDPALAIELTGQLAGESARRAQMDTIVDRWLAADVVGAIAWIDGHGDASLRTELLRGALGSYASYDPDAAAVMYGRLVGEGVEELDQAARWIANSMAERDSAQALTWAQGLEDEVARREAVEMVVKKIAQDDPQRAAAMIDSGLEDSDGAEWTVAKKLIEEGSASGFERALRLDPVGRRSVLSSALGQLTRDDPQEAARQLEIAGQFLEDGEWQQMGKEAVAIGGAWARYDLEGALGWAEGLAAGDLQDQVMGTLVGSWVNIDPVAASGWIAGLDEGVVQQQAVRRLAESIRDEDPEASFAWSQSLGEGRLEVMGATLETWGKVDAEAARAAVMASGLSEEERGKLLESLPE